MAACSNSRCEGFDMSVILVVTLVVQFSGKEQALVA